MIPFSGIIRILRVFRKPFEEKRDLYLLWVGQLASGFGDSLTFMAFIFLALDLTGSDRQVGAFQTIAYVPIIIFGLAAGVYVDRRDRRRVMLVADGGRALALGLIPLAWWLGILDITYAGITVMTITTLTTFFNPAYNSALPIIVNDPAQLFKVNALMQSSRQFAAIAGPGLAALGAARSGPVALLSVNAVTYAISFICIALIATPLASTIRGRIRWSELREGVRSGLKTVMENRSVRIIFIITLINNIFLMGPALVGTPLMVKKEFGGALIDYAMVELMYALGMTITGVILHQSATIRSLGVLWAVGLILDGITFIPYLWAETLWQVDLVTFLHALAIPMIVVSRATIIQRLVPQELLGRAFGYIDIAVLGVTALSSGLTGLVSAEIGPRLTLVFGGALAALAGVVALMIRDVRGVRFDG